ncbi:glycosyltransferase [Plantactinospora sp. GCM10030261]|uniref:glycosyltransferase n=1 Tax=Plantactinospora sp. GCM10030261 TaxID=3273420 RepID=UPI0036209DF7
MLVLVGTDTHPFHRLMDWLERWYAGRRDRPTMTVQYGRSRRPLIPGATAFLAHDDLERAITSARLVVTHGGPATIAETRAAGRLPIVVPRDPAHGEHVDEHQLRYAARLAATGDIHLCRSGGELSATLDRGLAAPATFRIDPVAEATRQAARTAAAARVGRIVEDLVRATTRSRRGAR